MLHNLRWGFISWSPSEALCFCTTVKPMIWRHLYIQTSVSITGVPSSQGLVYGNYKYSSQGYPLKRGVPSSMCPHKTGFNVLYMLSIRSNLPQFVGSNPPGGSRGFRQPCQTRQ